ncbi:MAG TPA: flagellar motor protein [Casimicrobiaceae bacterium]|nr:flagellar motor protein [Casimicrobiaceae bacterium]
MDVLSLVGLILGFIAIVGGQALEGGNLGSLVQGAAFVIVLGGTLAAVLVQTPLRTFIEGLRLARWVILPPRHDANAIIQEMVQWAGDARREGMLSLENRLTAIADAFTRRGLQMLVDGFEPQRIGEELEVETGAWEDRQRAAAKIWEAAGGYAPTIGILGAVLGLIHVMENLSDPNKLGGGIAVAFVATVYGVGSANLIYLPIANKLKTVITGEIFRRDLVREGLLAIANGENPKLMESRLTGYLA